MEPRDTNFVAFNGGYAPHEYSIDTCSGQISTRSVVNQQFNILRLCDRSYTLRFSPTRDFLPINLSSYCPESLPCVKEIVQISWPRAVIMLGHAKNTFQGWWSWSLCPLWSLWPSFRPSAVLGLGYSEPCAPIVMVNVAYYRQYYNNSILPIVRCTTVEEHLYYLADKSLTIIGKHISSPI